jgi:hypothetical protein
MTKYLKYLFYIVVLSFAGCIGAGTHGSIKGYQYSVNKDSLQNAIMTVIQNSPNIYRDDSLDSLGSSPLLDHDDGKDYVTGDNYYNDIKHYVTIKITSGQSVNDYTFRYRGDDEDWKGSNISRIFICYAYDKNGNGGSEGNGGVSKKMAKAFTDVFEKEFVDKVDEQLNLKHDDTE